MTPGVSAVVRDSCGSQSVYHTSVCGNFPEDGVVAVSEERIERLGLRECSECRWDWELPDGIPEDRL